MEDPLKPPLLLLLLLLSVLQILLFVRPIFSIDFVFNSFHPSNISLYGNASTESNILTLTNHTRFSMGRALYPVKIRTKEGNSSSVVLPFYTSFVFAMGPFKGVLPGHGLVFLFVPFMGLEKANQAQNLGFLNRTVNGNPDTHIFGIEFDVFKNEEFNDIDDNHVGVDVNSLTSIESQTAGYFVDDGNGAFQSLTLNNGRNYQVWIDFADSQLNVTMAIAGETRPNRPLISIPLNLSNVVEDEMYVGFTAGTGQLVQTHNILSWSFSNSNTSLYKELITTGLPSFVIPKDPIYKSKGFIAGMTVSLFISIVLVSVLARFAIKRKRRKAKERGEMEDWELEYWPHKIPYHEIFSATKGFSEKNEIGMGGNGKVYRGIILGGIEVAVKRIFPNENNEGMREFLSEIAILGRLKHRNLVGLRGWCKREKGSLILVYDYMENGSLDKRIFDSTNSFLGYEDRIRILKDVAHGVLYLHEGWEAKVLHRDIKSSNVLLDKEMKGRLGDFGLARMHGHGEVSNTTRVVGTIGYLAPETVRSGRVSTKTDVFGFGVLILEVLCGRRPIEKGKTGLVEWVWEIRTRGEIWKALDKRIRVRGEFNMEEAERVMNLGLMCVNQEPRSRPTMRQVVKLLDERDEVEVEEGSDVVLLGDMESRVSFVGGDRQSSSTSGGSLHHPTFEEIRTSMSLTLSDVAVQPR